MTKLCLHPDHLPAVKKIAYAMRDKARDEHGKCDPVFNPNPSSEPFGIKKAESLSLAAKVFGFKDWGSMQHELIHQSESACSDTFIPASMWGEYTELFASDFTVRDYFFIHNTLKPYIYTDEASVELERQLGAMANNPDASESVDEFYSSAAGLGYLCDLIILSGGTGYGIKLSKNGLEGDVDIMVPRFIKESSIITLDDDPNAMIQKMDDIVNQNKSGEEEAEGEMIFNGIKIYSESEGPFACSFPTFIVDILPPQKHAAVGPQTWREMVYQNKLSDNKCELYFLPTPIKDGDEEIHFVDKTKRSDDMVLFANSFYLTPEDTLLPEDAVILTDADRVYLSMAVREWPESVVAEKWDKGILKKEIIKYRNNQKICHALGI